MKDNKIRIIPIHVMIWAIVFGMPLLIFFSDSDMELRHYVGYMTQSVTYVIVFYVNFLFLIDKYFLKNNFKSFAVFNILLIAVCISGESALEGWIRETLIQPEEQGQMKRFKRISFRQLKAFGEILYCVLIIGIGTAVKVTKQWSTDQDRFKELQTAQTEAELKNLKSQLNPHFLFNTLNNIYVLTGIDQEKAQESIHKLSKLLRYTLYDDDRQFVPLERELDFVNNYIELMKLRLNPSTRLTVDIQGAIGFKIAPLIFIAVIENAFKHGIGNADSFIRIKINVEGSVIKCSAKNGMFPKSDDEQGSGIGLNNLLRRLQLIYPDKHDLVIDKNIDSFNVNLTIDLSPTK